MPLYDYLCRGCGERFEVCATGAPRATEVPCPSCGEARLTVLSTFAAGGAREGADRRGSRGMLPRPRPFLSQLTTRPVRPRCSHRERDSKVEIASSLRSSQMTGLVGGE